MKCSLTVYEDSGGEWRWQLQAANHRVVADSGEGYSSKRAAFNAARGLVKLVSQNARHLKPEEGKPAGGDPNP